MKLFKSSIFAVLGLAVAMTACSEDKDHPDYTPAGASAGAYFSAAGPKAYYVSADMTSFDVVVYRTKDAGATFQISADDPSGLFTVPTSVTFDGTELTTNLSIAFDGSKLVVDQPYTLTLTLSDVTGYGEKSYTFNVVKADPMETKQLGTGTYFYNIIYTNISPDPGLPAVISYMPSTPDTWTVTIQHWGQNINFNIEVPNVKDVDANGRTTVFVKPQLVEVDADYGRIFVADYYTYQQDYLKGQLGLNPSTPAPEDGSFYTINRGRFSLNLVYYIPDYETGTYYLTPQAYEYFQLDGYPNYDIEVTYDGLFIKKDGAMTANATIVAGDDAEEVKAVIVSGKDPQVGLDAITADGTGVQSFDQTGAFSASFPVTEGGDYTIVAVTVAEGEIQNASYDSFQVKIGDDSADWNTLGTGSMIDGWCLAGFTMGGEPIDVTEYAFTVPIQQHKTDPTLYRLVEPYGPNYILNANNAYPANRNVEFIVDAGIILIQPQPCGFGAASWGGEMSIGNQAGYILSVNEGATVPQVKNFMVDKGYTLDEFDAEEGYAMISKPWFGAPAIGDGSFGYTWNNVQASYIVMPAASSDVKAKVKAKLVAAPHINGLLPAIRAKKGNVTKSIKVASKYDTIHSMNLR